jgi:predicted glutamine amidotransferase
MCRLLGIVSRETTTLPAALGTDFDEFVALSSGLHSDGWGVAAESGGRRAITLAPEAAHASDAFTETASTSLDAGIVHLRAATLGLAIGAQNTHPFVHGDLSFAHNGSIRAISDIETLIDADLLPSILGDTDSERYLLALVSELRRQSRLDAVRTVARRLEEVAVEASINALLLAPDELIVIADDTAKAPVDMGADYYELSYRVEDDFVAIASSGWERDGWQRVPERTVLSVDRSTLEVTIRDLAPARTSTLIAA